MFLNNPGHHIGYVRKHPDSPFRIRTNSDITVAIARISLLFTTGFSGPILAATVNDEKFVENAPKWTPTCVKQTHSAANAMLAAGRNDRNAI